jgi:hypothetical protein
MDELQRGFKAAGVHAELIPGTIASRQRAAPENRKPYSGIAGLTIQDASIGESMAPIGDRTKENLVTTSNAIIITRVQRRKRCRRQARLRGWGRACSQLRS